ncbi:hypothetical protein [Roseateles oligotrophus]|uniref:Uncharacterized protein n=1 Tax=Roseateles oligotrophus TaxID=1769250 RepID=A0ABT2YAL8_9BURK|nr:hypothetical protein [Roseateles oligotrophus]MCV2367323.1 hypothetical protein [Roseateles oligotrophus]
MNWLARLKNKEGPKADPTKPTKPGFVGFVGTPAGTFANSGPSIEAANDPAHATPLQQERTTDATSQTPYWPNTQHANDSELDTMEARMMLFTRRGMADTEADQLADKLLQADRQQTGQVTCHLCQHFNPRRKTCSNFKQAGVGQEVGSDLAAMLQRCPGYRKGSTQ